VRAQIASLELILPRFPQPAAPTVFRAAFKYRLAQQRALPVLLVPTAAQQGYPLSSLVTRVFTAQRQVYLLLQEHVRSESIQLPRRAHAQIVVWVSFRHRLAHLCALHAALARTAQPQASLLQSLALQENTQMFQRYFVESAMQVITLAQMLQNAPVARLVIFKFSMSLHLAFLVLSVFFKTHQHQYLVR